MFEVEALNALLVKSPPPDAELDEQWAKEVDDRLAAYRRGEIRAVTLSEAIKKHRISARLDLLRFW